MMAAKATVARLARLPEVLQELLVKKAELPAVRVDIKVPLYGMNYL